MELGGSGRDKMPQEPLEIGSRKKASDQGTGPTRQQEDMLGDDKSGSRGIRLEERFGHERLGKMWNWTLVVTGWMDLEDGERKFASVDADRTCFFRPRPDPR